MTRPPITPFPRRPDRAAAATRMVEPRPGACAGALAALCLALLASGQLRAEEDAAADSDVVVANGLPAGDPPTGDPALLNGARRSLALQGLEQRVIDAAGLSYVSDWRALERLGATDADFPGDAGFLDRRPDLWEAYRWTVIGALGVGALLFVLAGALLASLLAHRRREHALAESELRFRALADNIPQLAWMARGDGFMFWFNQRWRDFTGQTNEEAQGWGWRDVHHPDHVDRVVERIQRAWDTGEPWEDTFPLRGADGRYRWFLSRARPVRDEAGRVKLWFGTNTDITRQLEADEALRESEERLVAVVEQLSEGLAIFDGEGRAVHWNPAALRMHGFEEMDRRLGDMESFGALFELRPLDEDRPLGREEWMVSRILRGETVHDAEYRVIHKIDGWERIFAFSGSLARSESGETLVVLVIADVTERRRDEERERLLMREVDHRAKNALAVVLALVKLTRADSIGAFKRAVDGRVTALARTHSLLAENRWDELALDTVIGEELAAYPQDQISWGGPAIAVNPSAVQPLSMVMHELATNAAKHGALSTQSGRLEIRWEETEKGALRLTWTERGGPETGPPERLGFGARLIRDTVERQLRGRVEHEWAREGLTCRLTLEKGWAWRRDGRHAALPPAEAPASATPQAAAEAAPSRRVLVVEDDALIAARIEDDLRRADLQVLGPVGTVEAALKLARSEGRIDAALVDLNLHGVPAWPVIETLRARGAPFAVATGYSGQVDDLPAESVLSKPFSTTELLDHVARLLSEGGTAEPAERETSSHRV